MVLRDRQEGPSRGIRLEQPTIVECHEESPGKLADAAQLSLVRATDRRAWRWQSMPVQSIVGLGKAAATTVAGLGPWRRAIGDRRSADFLARGRRRSEVSI